MNVCSTKELRAKIASEDHGAELCLQHAMANIDALEMQIEMLRKDAERYRWLRQREVEVRRYALVGVRASERIDDQIDAAIEEARAVGAA